MVHLVVTHGRAHEFGIPATLGRDLEDALRWGLERAGSPIAASVPVSLAFYGDEWRPDATDVEGPEGAGGRPASELQRQLAADLIGAAGGDPSAQIEGREGVGWQTVGALAAFLDQHLHVGEAVLRLFLDDVERYFADEELRRRAVERALRAVTEAGTDVVLLAHSLGSIVAYDLLRQRPELPLRGLLTFGSPLGLPTIRRRLGAGDRPNRFPPGAAHWANVFDPRDLVTAGQRLAPHFPSDDGRLVEDHETRGRPAGPWNPTAPHDAVVYLSSISLGRALRAIVEGEAPTSAAAGEGVERPEAAGPTAAGWAGIGRAGRASSGPTAGDTGEDEPGPEMVGHYRGLLRGDRAGNLEGGEGAGGGEVDLSEAGIRDRLDATRSGLHKIVADHLDGRTELYAIADEIVRRAGGALRLLGEGDERGLRAQPKLLESLEAIVRTDGSRPSFLVRNGKVDLTTSPVRDWATRLNLSADLLKDAIACVGRINVPSAVQGFEGTGFLVGRDLILTNRHVLQAIGTREDDGSWTLNPEATIDFGHEFRARPSVNRRALRQVVFCGAHPITHSVPYDHGRLDLALIELGPDGDDGPSGVLAVDAAPDWARPSLPIFTIGYPGQPMDGASLFPGELTMLEQLFQSTFGFKRLAPGLVVASRRNVPGWTAAHDATTLGGNSGSVLLVAGREHVAAGLHYGGRRTAPPDDLGENWGHVLGSVLDETDGRSDATLRDCLKQYGVRFEDRRVSGPR